MFNKNAYEKNSDFICDLYICSLSANVMKKLTKKYVVLNKKILIFLKKCGKISGMKNKIQKEF